MSLLKMGERFWLSKNDRSIYLNDVNLHDAEIVEMLNTRDVCITSLQREQEAQASRICANCKHWEAYIRPKDIRFESYTEPKDLIKHGKCPILLRILNLDTQLHAEVFSIEPPDDFGCNNFEEK